MRLSHKPSLRTVAFAMLAVLLAISSASAQTLQLTGAGATFPYPIYSKWFDEYYKLNPGVQINYQSIGSGGGIRQMLAQTVDFGATDAPMSDEDLARAGREILHIPTVIGSVAVVYNIPGIGSGLKLTPDVLAGIFLGEIQRWDDPRIQGLNPELDLPGLAIAVARRSDGSGTTFTFSDYLSTVSAKWEERVGRGTSLNWPVGLGAKGNEGVAGLVRQLPGAIGYVEQAYATQNRLAHAALQNKEGVFVLPSLTGASQAAAGVELPDDYRASIVNPAGEDAYPIATFTWLLVYKEALDPVRGKALADFLWWALHEGQEHAPALGYAPLPAELVERLEDTLYGLTYNGVPLLDARR